MAKVIGSVFEIKHNISQIVKAVVEDTLSSASMLFELERLEVMEPFAR